MERHPTERLAAPRVDDDVRRHQAARDHLRKLLAHDGAEHLGVPPRQARFAADRGIAERRGDRLDVCLDRHADVELVDAQLCRVRVGRQLRGVGIGTAHGSRALATFATIVYAGS
jgi:hypothetical protein